MAEAGPPAKEGRAFYRDGQTGRETRILSDPRSIHLLHLMSEMDQGAKLGEPNPKFMAAAATALNDSSFQRRQKDFQLLMEKMRPEDAPAIHKMFLEMERSGRPMAEEYVAFATRWGMVDGAGAMALYAEKGGEAIKPDSLYALFNGWGHTHPEEAVAWLDQNKQLLGNLNGYTNVVMGWLSQDTVAATEWLSNHPLNPGELGGCVTGATLNMLYSDGLEGVCSWLAGLPQGTPGMGEASRDGWKGIQNRFRDLDGAQAAQAWGHIANEPWMRAEDFNQFCQTVAAANHNDLQSFADTLSKSWPAQTAAAQLDRWAETRPDVLAETLGKLPPGDLRSTGIQALVKELDRSDPAAATAWRKELER